MGRPKVSTATREHEESRKCWCSPLVLVYEYGDVIVHNRGDN